MKPWHYVVSWPRETASEVVRRRGATLGALQRTLHGELEWIAMKAFEKEHAEPWQCGPSEAFSYRRSSAFIGGHDE